MDAGIELRKQVNVKIDLSIHGWERSMEVIVSVDIDIGNLNVENYVNHGEL